MKSKQYFTLLSVRVRVRPARVCSPQPTAVGLPFKTDICSEEKKRYTDLANIEKDTFNESLPAHLVKLPAGWKRQTDACSKLS